MPQCGVVREHDGTEERGSTGDGEAGVSRIQSHEELEVYGLAFKAAMQIFELSKRFPREEAYCLTDQIRRSSRSVCSNLADAWRKRRHEAAFVSKLNDAESEAGETQTWVRFAGECGYFSKDIGHELNQTYDHIIGKLVHMIINPTPWILRGSVQ
jgi:four helix bundle protein